MRQCWQVECDNSEGTRLRNAAKVALAVALGAAACGGPVQTQLPEDPNIRALDLCSGGAALPPLSGVLVAAPMPRQVLLKMDTGAEATLLWPPGFGLDSSSGAIFDPTGANVFSIGHSIILDQVSPHEHAGTADDPYRVVGVIGRVCYGIIIGAG